MDSLPSVSVVVPTRNNAHEVRRDLLPTLFATDSNGFVQDAAFAPLPSTWKQTVIVDQSELPELRGDLERAGLLASGRVEYLWTPEQRGASRARNAALPVVTSDVIAFLDSDILVAPDHVAKIARIFGEYPQLMAMYAPVHVHEPTWRARGGTIPCFEPSTQRLFDTLDPELRLGMSANFAIRTDLARRFEFDEFLGAGSDFPSYEDIDIVARMSRAGLQYGVFLEPVALHTGSRVGNDVKQWARDTERGSGAFGAKSLRDGDFHSVVVCLREIVGMAWRGLRQHRHPEGITRLVPYLGGLVEALALYEVDPQTRRFRGRRFRGAANTRS